VVVENSRSRSPVFLWSHFVAKRYILQQKCLKGQIGTCLLGTRWYNFWPCTPTLRATMHSVTDRHTDRQQAAANSRSYCVAVRSAKNCCKIRSNWIRYQYIFTKPFETTDVNIVEMSTKLSFICVFRVTSYRNNVLRNF